MHFVKACGGISNNFFLNCDSLHVRLNSQPLRSTELQEKEAQKDYKAYTKYV